MKIRDYTYQTGHCLTHETSANRMHPEVRKIITRLIAAGRGSLPGFGGCTYQFVSESDDLASLTMLLPSAAGAPFELIQVLGGMPRDFATVWFTQQFGDLA